jgi:uncharacterized membrane protein YtjA (UPF0391 family)
MKDGAMTALWIAMAVILSGAVILRFAPGVILSTGIHKVVFFVAAVLFVVSMMVDLARTPKAVLARRRP